MIAASRSYLLLIFIAFVAFSCSSGSGDECRVEIDELNLEIKNLKSDLLNRDSTMATIIGAYGSIDSNLRKVEAKKARIAELAKKKKLSRADKEEIKLEMDSINFYLQKNKSKVADLQLSFTAQDSATGMSIMLQSLSEKNEIQDTKIVDMKQDLAQISKDFSDLFEDYIYKEAENMEIKEALSSTEEELKAAREKLYSAYYVVGSADELRENGIVYKGGLFDSESVNEDFDKAQFKKVNIDEFKELILDTKRAKIITTHPTESYELVGIKKQVNKMVIRNPEQFWSVSKFLIIEVER